MAFEFIKKIFLKDESVSDSKPELSEPVSTLKLPPDQETAQLCTVCNKAVQRLKRNRYCNSCDKLYRIAAQK